MLTPEVSQIISEYGNGQLPTFTTYGCCPLFYVNNHNDVLCSACANNHAEYDETIVAYDTNWEDPDLYCDHCSKRIESAYAEEEVDVWLEAETEAE